MPRPPPPPPPGTSWPLLPHVAALSTTSFCHHVILPVGVDPVSCLILTMMMVTPVAIIIIIIVMVTLQRFLYDGGLLVMVLPNDNGVG